MKLRFIYWGIACIAALLVACKKEPSYPLEPYEWLLGAHTIFQDDGSHELENWEKVSDTLFRGTYKNKDLIIRETIELRWENNAVWYCPTVRDQNDGKEVRFKLISEDVEQLVFENKAHDFPQRIGYENRSHMIKAWIEGVNEKGDSLHFDTFLDKVNQ